MKDEDILKIAFKERYGHHDYLVIPFGVSNDPDVFREYMNRIFHPYLDQFIVVFIDDILMHSKSDEDDVGNLCTVLEVLQEKKLYAKLSKCEFWLLEVSSLSHVISSGGIATDPSKVDVVLQREAPKSFAEIKSFLGLASYYRIFVKGFSKLSIPLNQLTRKGQAFGWGVMCEENF